MILKINSTRGHTGSLQVLYNCETHWIRRADVQYTSPLTMLFTIGFSDACILVPHYAHGQV